MKNLITSFAVLVMFISCKNQDKIGFIDNVKVVNEYYKKLEFESSFQKKIDAFNKKSDSLQNAIQLEAQLWQNRSTKVDQRTAEKEYETLLQKKQLQDFQLNNEERQLQQEGQQRLDTIVKEVKQFVNDYGKANGYTFILGANEAGSVLYGSDSKDITEEVLQELNKSKTTN